MLSINTNLQSFIAQNSLRNSNLKLNTAIERMTTGYKINGAKDNAANYSITTNMTTKIGGYQVAEDNCAMGLDLLSTANESLNLISDKLARLRALAEQADNGTYGNTSLGAINAEAKAIVDETNRIFNTTEYNGNKLFGHSGKFLEDITARDTSKMDSLESVDANTTITSGTYSISSAEELAKLATMTDNGNIQGGEYVLANDIDLSEYSTGAGWNPIGANNWGNTIFIGTFDGNGHIISNLYINRPGVTDIGLFASVEGTVKNLGLENVNITGGIATGALCGMQLGPTISSTFENCYVSNGKISSTKSSAGGLCGEARTPMSIIKSCYTENLDITAAEGNGGGLIGGLWCSNNPNWECLIEDCYSIGCNITGSQYCLGGLIGNIGYYGLIRNCYSNNNITGNYPVEAIGGLIGNIYSSTENVTLTIEDCYAEGNINVNRTDYGNCGGFIGCLQSDTPTNIIHCYSKGNVSCPIRAGGFIGLIKSGEVNIESCYASGVAEGNSYVGSFIAYKNTKESLSIKNSYVLGISPKTNGVFLGYNRYNSENIIENCKYNSYYDDINRPLVSGSYASAAITENNTVCDDTAPFKLGVLETNLQVGIYGDKNSQISFETSFSLKGICDLYNLGLDDKDYFSTIDELINRVSAKQTEFGAVQNRLESALDEISTQYENLSSSRSTLQDADIANVSAEYIKQQILQQASATLMATANQSPALALQLL